MNNQPTDDERARYQRRLDTFVREGLEQAEAERLAGSAPIHASPLEHQATPHPSALHVSRNLRGWQQFRELFEEQTW